MNVYFTNEIRHYLELFGSPMALIKIQMEIQKISRRRPRSVDGAELGHFPCCFAEDGKEMYKDL